MAGILRTALLLAIIAFSALGVLALLPFAKEGASWGDLPIFAGVAGVAAALALLWWLAVGRRFGRAAIGWTILLVPLVAHSAFLALLANARLEGRRLAESARIERYREQFITWPGFDGPVGLQISLDLHHAAGIDALLLSPELHFGPAPEIPHDQVSASLTGGSGYLRNDYLPRPLGDFTLLKPVLFQRVFESTKTDPNYAWDPSFRLDPAGSTELTYFLLPGTIDYLPDRTRVCLNSRSHGIPVCMEGQKPEAGCAPPGYPPPAGSPIYAQGQDLSALWVAAGAHDMIADLSTPLTTALRQYSGLQSHPEMWTAIQRRLEPDGLTAAGYRLCPAGDDSHTAFRTCFCANP